MTKLEFIAAVAEKTGSTKVEAEKNVNAFLAVITEALKHPKCTGITFTGFGSFETSTRAARKGRNPQTGAEINIPAARVPKFKPGKTLKDAVNL